MIAILIASAIVSGQQVPVPPREFRAAWVATVDNIDWPSRKGLSTEQARQELLDLINRCQALKLNAIVLQVRPMADALYESKTEPWSEYLTGTQGKPPSPKWDPLAFAVQHCHERGIELHAWFNPFRAWHSSAKSPPSRLHVTKRHPELVRTYGKQKWLDPGDPRVRDHSLRAILDVVKRYDIDGVHIDDYFYPYPLKGSRFPDSSTNKLYGRGQSLSAWRRSNVDQFVERMYREVHRAKPWVKVGISPFGIYRPGIPKGIEAGLDQFSELYADPRKWLRLGWLDYVTPQLYWAIEPKKQSFPILLEWWKAENIKGRHVWPGLATYKMVEGPKWEPGEILNQILETRDSAVGGHVHFSVKYLLRNTKGIGSLLSEDAYETRSLVPASNWLNNRPPSAPQLVSRKDRTDARNRRVTDIQWKSSSAGTSDFVWSRREGNEWSEWSIDRTGMLTVSTETAHEIAVYARDRMGNLSDPLMLKLRAVE